MNVIWPSVYLSKMFSCFQYSGLAYLLLVSFSLFFNAIGSSVFICLVSFFFLFKFFGHAVRCMGSLFPNQGSNLCLLHLQHGVLITGPTKKSLILALISSLTRRCLEV